MGKEYMTYCNGDYWSWYYGWFFARYWSVKKIWQKVLSAVEITTSYKGNILHLLAYDFPYYHQELSRRLSEIQAQRILRTETIITLLNDDLNNEWLEIIESSEILKMWQEKPISPSDIALYLLKNKYINSLQEAFDRWLWGYNIPNDNFSISEAIDLVRSTGGVAVLAHPFAQDISLKAIGFDLKSQVEMLKELRTLGLDWFEVYHFRGNSEIEKLYWDIALNLWMIATGGSDFHGKSYSSIAVWIGENNASDRVINEIHTLSTSRK